MALLTRFFRAAIAIAWKDLRIELRTGEIVTTAGFFAVLVAVMASLAFYGGPSTAEKVAPGALWLPVAFASVLALSRTWQREREEGALTGILISPAPRGAIFVGKAIGVFAFVVAVECVVVPVVALMMHVDLAEALPTLALLFALGTIGLAATGTLFGAMTVRTRARDLVLASVLFPLLSPTLLAGIGATRELLSGAPFDELYDYFLLFGVFDSVAIAGGIGLFGTLVDE